MLADAQIEFDEIDLSQDEAAMAMVKKMGYVAAPVVIAGDAHWSGFRHSELQHLIARYRTERVHAA
jgi:glutaredoxin-like protein NrdH